MWQLPLELPCAKGPARVTHLISDTQEGHVMGVTTSAKEHRVLQE